MKFSGIFQSHPIEQSSEHYELGNHLGNVLAVVTDNIHMADDLTTATVASASDYYPFGLQMDSRTVNDGDYRYGFNGKEKDQDGEFDNTHYDYGFRTYNPAIAKFLSVDPLTASYPWYTPYQFAGNTPIQAIDLDGLEPTKSTESITLISEDGESTTVLRTVYHYDVIVLVIEPWNRANGKEPKDRLTSTFTLDRNRRGINDTDRIEKGLNEQYNWNLREKWRDSDGQKHKAEYTGNRKSNGDLVYFDFNVRSVIVDEDENFTRQDLNDLRDRNGIITNKLLLTDQEGNDICTVAKPAILIDHNNAFGTSVDKGMTIGSYIWINLHASSTYGHELLHYVSPLGNDRDHAIGNSSNGLLNTPKPGRLSSTEIDLVDENALPVDR
jgi:RHS repeat-associated protein